MNRLPIGDRNAGRYPARRADAFYHDWYRPDLMAVIAVGDFDAAESRGSSKAHFAGLPDPPASGRGPCTTCRTTPARAFAIATDTEATGTRWPSPTSCRAATRASVGAYRQMLVEELFTGMLNRALVRADPEGRPTVHRRLVGRAGGSSPAEVYVADGVVKDDGIPRGLQALLAESARVGSFGFTATELERQKRDMLRASRARSPSGTAQLERLRRPSTSATSSRASRSRHRVRVRAVQAVPPGHHARRDRPARAAWLAATGRSWSSTPPTSRACR